MSAEPEGRWVQATRSSQRGLVQRAANDAKAMETVEEEAPAESPRTAGTMVVAGGADPPGPLGSSPTGGSPERRRASLIKWSKGSPQKTLRSKSERADDPSRANTLGSLDPSLEC